MLTAVATKSLKIVIFNHLMLVDANCDDSVTIPRRPNLVVDLKVSVALKKETLCAYARILGTLLFQILNPPLGGLSRSSKKVVQLKTQPPGAVTSESSYYIGAMGNGLPYNTRILHAGP